MFKKKQNEDGLVIQNKAKLVEQGLSQSQVKDYEDTFAHVARLKAIHLLFACVYFHDFKLYQMNFKSAFVIGPLEELVYVAKPSDFKDSHHPNHTINSIRLSITQENTMIFV